MVVFGGERGPIFRSSVVLTKIVLKSVPPPQHPPLVTRNMPGTNSIAVWTEDISENAAKMKKRCCDAPKVVFRICLKIRFQPIFYL